MRETTDIKKDIAKWKDLQFSNRMADHWGKEEYDFNDLCNRTIRELERELAEAERKQG